MCRGAAFFIITLLVATGHASTWNNIPDFYSQYATFGIAQIALGITCDSAIPHGDQRPCNPALAPYSEERSAMASLSLGGDYSQIFKYAKYINQNDKFGLAQSILNEQSPTEFNGMASLGYTTHAFNIWASPIHTYYFSEVRNSVNPNVNLIAMQEASIAAQYGIKLDENWSVGLQVAGFDRKFVSVQGAIFDVIADPNSYLGTNGQSGLFFEPGVAFILQDPWHFRLTGMVRELGFISQTFAQVPMGTTFDFGTGFSVPIDPSWGAWDFLFGVTGGPDSPDRTAPWRVSSTYKIGLVDSFIGYDPDTFSLGANVGFDTIRVGLMFQQLETDQTKNSIFSQASYVF